LNRFPVFFGTDGAEATLHPADYWRVQLRADGVFRFALICLKGHGTTFLCCV
jgi:hypothetical protein